MRLKYVPNPKGYLKPNKAETLDEFFNSVFSKFRELVEKLFTDKEVIEAVNNNDFVKVFEACRKISYENTVAEDVGINLLVLCHFLYLLNIDFELPYDYIKKNFFHNEDWKSVPADKWDDRNYFQEVKE